MKIFQYRSTETYEVCRSIQLSPRGTQNMSYETYVRQNRSAKESSRRFGSIDLLYPSPGWISRLSHTFTHTCTQNTHTSEYIPQPTRQRQANPKRPTWIKRDLYESKDTYIHQERPMYMTRNLLIIWMHVQIGCTTAFWQSGCTS